MFIANQLFALSLCGPERRDGTAPYRVVFRIENSHPTVSQFLNSITACKYTCGDVMISPDQSYKTVWDVMRCPRKVDILKYVFDE